jgi:hypothetical protein
LAANTDIAGGAGGTALNRTANAKIIRKSSSCLATLATIDRIADITVLYCAEVAVVIVQSHSRIAV